MFLILILTIGLAIWLVTLLFPRFDTRSNSPHSLVDKEASQETALEIARKRYARGELTQAEFETMRQQLSH
ncbi:MAG: SHOCT domain-containing protein [Caldilineales bacterium]|nr:SHOCT domain-containing protein [Caldilineales bacterium]